MHDKERVLLVGDNPFHGISHLSQDRARTRDDMPSNMEDSAKLVIASIENGANGFMFSVSENTLAVLKIIRERGYIDRISLYAIVPYMYEYVRLYNRVGMYGLAKEFAKKVALSGNTKAITTALFGFISSDPICFTKTYLSYEISRIKSSAGTKSNLQSVLLHEVITDMFLAFNYDWFFKSYVEFLLKLGVMPGFNTSNFTHLVKKLKECKVDLNRVTIATPFNKVGFQMNPSKIACERVLKSIPDSNVIAISILAAGYLSPAKGIAYISKLQNINGVVAGVSKLKHAQETFKLLRDNFQRSKTC
jgi:hypothetical protein